MICVYVCYVVCFLKMQHVTLLLPPPSSSILAPPSFALPLSSFFLRYYRCLPRIVPRCSHTPLPLPYHCLFSQGNTHVHTHIHTHIHTYTHVHARTHSTRVYLTPLYLISRSLSPSLPLSLSFSLPLCLCPSSLLFLLSLFLSLFLSFISQVQRISIRSEPI